MSVMFNEICIDEEMLRKYNYIYIYVCLCVCLRVRACVGVCGYEWCVYMFVCIYIYYQQNT